jgi:hypothetical protein
MTISKKRVLLLALALSAVGVMSMASVASATHPRPATAPKIVTSFVPAFDECTAATPPNRSHGPPLLGASCNPPVKTSDALQNGAGMVASGKLAVQAGTPGAPEDSDVKITLSATDVRCDNDTVGDSTACGAPNSSGGPDYGGILVGLATIRISDHWNAVAAGGGPDPATVVDLPFGAVIPGCAVTTGDPSVGSTCSVVTSANAQVGGPDPAVKDGKRAVVEISQISVYDGGVDGVTAPPASEVFLNQGIFIP